MSTPLTLSMSGIDSLLVKFLAYPNCNIQLLKSPLSSLPLELVSIIVFSPQRQTLSSRGQFEIVVIIQMFTLLFFMVFIKNVNTCPDG